MTITLVSQFEPLVSQTTPYPPSFSSSHFFLLLLFLLRNFSPSPQPILLICSPLFPPPHLPSFISSFFSSFPIFLPHLTLTSSFPPTFSSSQPSPHPVIPFFLSSAFSPPPPLTQLLLHLAKVKLLLLLLLPHQTRGYCHLTLTLFHRSFTLF